MKKIRHLHVAVLLKEASSKHWKRVKQNTRLISNRFEDETTSQGISEVFVLFTGHDSPKIRRMCSLSLAMTEEIFGDVGVPWRPRSNRAPKRGL